MLFIIWGFKVVFKTIGNGVFSCPNCGADRNYERRRAQRFFQVFFIPIIPLKVVGEVVRCTACKNDFRITVLERPIAAQVSDLLQNTVRGVMVNVLRRGGAAHPAARAAAVNEVALAGAQGYTEANLDADMQVVPADLSPLLGPLAGQLPDSGREALVAGAARVAAADGPITPAERQVLDLVGAGLGMTAAHVAGVVAQAAPGRPAMAPAAYAPSAADALSDSMATQLIPPAPQPVQDPANMPTQAMRIPQQNNGYSQQ